ncbi:TIGR02678 family protein [Catenuloplanes indicus]|uniref:Uncharacterized protein (TIGR02678 family) n=1 Tax=Catenuloplanes indicus TaxID=137267 RepID=A0AAE3VWL2_9ACTN|nr:TIGR02678 family protein [Catenuloplanes indicus]MDQ0365066.1 uncharacterized protein (TIGR02678 family) [Catenuloplanes indicus]
MTDPPTTSTSKAWRPRRAREPEAAQETAAVLRLLMVHPWLVSGRDDAAIATVRRHETAVREALHRLGWLLVVDRDFVRLMKTPPVRRDAWAATGPKPLTGAWFFLLVAAAESMPSRVGIGQLVTAARTAAAEAGVPARDDRPERHAILAALKMLDARGVVETIDGDIDEFLRGDDAPVLLAVHHHRLVHVIANFPPADPVTDPADWLDLAEREPDPARRMRRRLVDDTAVYTVDLDTDEADWMSRRVRGDDGQPLAEAFGLHLERRVEGAAFVVPDGAFRTRADLGDRPFPAGGTIPHAALLTCDAAGTEGMVDEDRPGWRGLHRDDVLRHLGEFAPRYTGRGWSAEHIANLPGLADEVAALLTDVNLLRIHDDMWWFAPAAGRWEPPPEPSSKPRNPPPAAAPEEPHDH